MPLGAALYQPQIRVGVAIFPEHGHEILELLKAADIALAEAKRQNVSHRIYDPSSNPYHPEHFAIEHRLREGISKRELVAHYQSIFDLRTKQTVGFEALVRWQRQGRLIPPGDFIPVAEQTRLVGALDRAVIEMGLQQMGRWKTEGFEPEVSFNMSAQSLSIMADFTWLTDLIAEHGLDPRNMVFELTESAMLENRALTQRVLGSLRNIGAGVAIDDFGSGYASLAYLRHLPVTRLKLDRTLTAHIGSGNREEKLLLSAMQLGQNLGLEVLAEGVETPEQVHWLEAHRCDLVQGFLFGHPRSAGDLMMQQYVDKPLEKKVVTVNPDATLLHTVPPSA
ncbi:MAG: putative bifunctional diguanylate cyclase/phosphodiesterase, partial [Casimicrobium sp.]